MAAHQALAYAGLEELVSLSDWHPRLDVITSHLKQTEVLIVVRTHRQAEAALLGLFQWLSSRFGL